MPYCPMRDGLVGAMPCVLPRGLAFWSAASRAHGGTDATGGPVDTASLPSAVHLVPRPIGLRVSRGEHYGGGRLRDFTAPFATPGGGARATLLVEQAIALGVVAMQGGGIRVDKLPFSDSFV